MGAMAETSEPRLARWPFYLGDVLLLGVALAVSVALKVLLGVEVGVWLAVSDGVAVSVVVLLAAGRSPSCGPDHRLPRLRVK